MYKRSCPVHTYALFCFLSLCFVFLFPIIHIYAQNWGIANTYNVSDTSAVDGDIMTINPSDNAFVRTSMKEGEEPFGVYVDTPTVVLRSDPTFIPIVREGDVEVNITTLNGPIAVGDAIAVSPIPGKGQKAGETSVQSIGTALAAFQTGDGSKDTWNGTEIWTGKIHVALRVGSSKSESVETSGGFVDQIKQILTVMLNTLKKGEDIAKLLRFLVAGIVAAITVYMAFTLFGRNITKGVEAIGRNPLAKFSIQSMIIVNIILIGIVTIGGVLLTLVIIKF